MNVLRVALAASTLALVLAGPAAAQEQTPDYPAPIEVLPTTIDRAPEPEPAPAPAPEPPQAAPIELPRTGVDAGMLAAAGAGALAAGGLVLRRRRS